MIFNNITKPGQCIHSITMVYKKSIEENVDDILDEDEYLQQIAKNKYRKSAFEFDGIGAGRARRTIRFECPKTATMFAMRYMDRATS